MRAAADSAAVSMSELRTGESGTRSLQRNKGSNEHHCGARTSASAKSEQAFLLPVKTRRL
jgi:hypothetical protein